MATIRNQGEFNMKKWYGLMIGVVCMSIFMFFNTVIVTEAAESRNGSMGNAAVDPRPDYTVYVNRALNCITVVQQEADGTMTPVKAMVCSCGKEGHETPEGVFRTSNYYEWRQMVDRSYGRYAVRFNGSILFHSVPYTKPSPDSLKWDEYNALGENASLGCVRLSAADAKWIYDNCKPGTTVVVYSDSETAGLLEKPTALKIDGNSPCRGWDPTDADINNPWFTAANGTVPAAGSIDEFNYTEYADTYPDLMAAFGYDRDLLYTHYVTYGIREGRTATFSPAPAVGSIDGFNYTEYADTYPDLMAAFGYDRDLLYTHYVTYGIKEGRTASFS
jgi:hypothetical protein